MPHEISDAIIIGGGVQGASLAFHLARRGLKPLVLERRFLAAEASGYSSGLVRMHYDLELDARLAWASFQYFRNWAEMVGGECGFTRTGFIQLVEADQAEHLRANLAMQQRLGIPTLLVSNEDVRRLALSFFTDDFELAAYEPESGYADPTGTTRAFMEAARRDGAGLIQECAVTGIRQQGGRVVGVDTLQGEFDAPLVINVAGAWAAAVAKMVDLDIPVTTWRHETLFVRRPAELAAGHPTVIDEINAMYFRPETGGLTLVGLEDGNPLGESPENNTGKARPGFVERAVERICKRIPSMERGVLQSTCAGYDGLTPDMRPLLGPAGPQGFYLACGFSGTGFKTAPAVGASLAEWILDGSPATVDVTPLSPQRFSDGALLHGEHSYGNVWR